MNNSQPKFTVSQSVGAFVVVVIEAKVTCMQNGIGPSLLDQDGNVVKATVREERMDPGSETTYKLL
ncbi:MAG: hypothetical protein KAU38_06555 [Desulfobacterales bacterium]|nr:hypothetical protein [Desulfobacterales bacterium]